MSFLQQTRPLRCRGRLIVVGGQCQRYSVSGLDRFVGFELQKSRRFDDPINYSRRPCQLVIFFRIAIWPAW